MRSFGSTLRGLSTAEVAKRFVDVDEWRISPTKPPSPLRVFARQLWSPFVAVLVCAAAISWWDGHLVDAALTLVTVCANVFLGFIQELQADRAFFALQQYLPKTATVRRDGVTMVVEADQLVPGDILLIRAGQHVLADGRVLEAVHLAVSEAALSGESNAGEKNEMICPVEAQIFDRRNMVYAGTSIVSGEGTVLVTRLGRQTEFGNITTLTTDVGDRETPLKQEMRVLARFLTIIILLVACVMFGIGVTHGIPVMSALMLAAALAIAAIPEGLPMTLTVLLSAAMRRMLKRGVLVRRLVATEALGCINVLCVDKTGTLTTGVMEVVEVRDRDGHHQRWEELPEGLLRRALIRIASVYRASGDVAFAGAATIRAMTNFVKRKEAKDAALDTKKLQTLPFDPAYRFSAYQMDATTVAVMGAPDVLLERVVSLHDRVLYQEIVEDMAARGLRVIMIATCAFAGSLVPESVHRCTVLGCIGIQDPLRSSVPRAMTETKAAGIRTIIITGDHPETARSIGAEALGHSSLTVMLGEEFAQKSPTQRLRAVEDVNIFARMLPQHKLLVVEALHAHGLRVAMTGDGVNDAPALKAADVGIAVGHATEVAKEASDLVLIDGDFRNIVHAIAEGRSVFKNARNVTIFLLSLGLGATFSIIGSFLFDLPLPLTPMIILWLNIITDGIPGIFFAFEPQDPHAMREPPRNGKDGLISSEVRGFFLYAIAVLCIVLSAALVAARMVQIDATMLRSATYFGLGFLGILFIFVTRSLRQSFIKNLMSRSPLRIGALIGFGFLLLPFVVTPLRDAFRIEILTPELFAGVMFAVLLIVLPLDFAKRRFRRS